MVGHQANARILRVVADQLGPRQYGEYENSVGTGQVHVWFDRPRGGFPRPRRTVIDEDYLRQTAA